MVAMVGDKAGLAMVGDKAMVIKRI